MREKLENEIKKKSCKSIRNKDEGITLIALVITIIVLLILAAVSIAMLTGQNGILTQANNATEETKIAEYKEALEMIKPGLDVEKATDGLSDKEYMDRYEEEIKKDNTFKDATVTREDDETIKVVTKEGYSYEVTAKGVEYKGKQGESTPPDLQESDVEFTMDPSIPTKESVKVSIETKITGYTLQYSIDEGKTWNEYASEITVTNNGPIYVRLTNSSGQAGEYATGNVSNIDRLGPNMFTPSATSTSNSITLTGSTEDAAATETDGSSGIQAYYFSKDNGATWEPTGGKTDTSYTFNNLTPDTVYDELKMKAVDKAGNETVTDPISISTQMLVIDGATIPKGFYHVEETKVKSGLVISSEEGDDLNNSKAGNQYVWIPVDGILGEERKTVQNAKDGEIILGRYVFDSNGKIDTDNAVIPEAIGGELKTSKDGFAYTEPSTGITAAQNITEFIGSVRKYGGYYIARFEASEGQNGKAESKYNKPVWNFVVQSQASTACEHLYNGVNSDLVNSYAWDTAILFIQKYGNKNYSNKTSVNTDYESINTGMSGDVQLNIYDMASNCEEWTTETTSAPGYPFVSRGGSSFSSNSVSYRNFIDMGVTGNQFGFRSILYL